MSTYVYPRLAGEHAETLVGALANVTPEEATELVAYQHPQAAPAAIGRPVPDERLRELRDAVVETAQQYGFPDKSARKDVAEFDRHCGELLFSRMEIVPADAGSIDVWSFLTLVVLPDVGLWRFPSAAASRLRGVPRNAFRRTWHRRYVLGDGAPPDGVDPLGEDELVGIFERTFMAADHRLARSVANTILERATDTGTARSEIMRDFCKRIVRLQPVYLLDALTDEDLGVLLAEQCDASVVALGGKPRADQAPTLVEEVVLPAVRQPGSSAPVRTDPEGGSDADEGLEQPEIDEESPGSMPEPESDASGFPKAPDPGVEVGRPMHGYSDDEIRSVVEFSAWDDASLDRQSPECEDQLVRATASRLDVNAASIRVYGRIQDIVIDYLEELVND